MVTVAGEQLATRLAGEIRAEHEQAQEAFASAVEHAVRCGELLLEAKAQVGHGGWGAWLDEHFPASRRSAQGYMRLARHGAEAQALAHLGVEGALRELAAPPPDREPLAPDEPLAPEERARLAELEATIEAAGARRAAALADMASDAEDETVVFRAPALGLPAGVVLRTTGIDAPDDLSYDDWLRVRDVLRGLWRAAESAGLAGAGK